MATRKIIPDVYTDYEDGHIGAIPPGLANVEIKIGAATGGKLNTFYTLSGPDAKAMAKTVFKGGPLLRAVEEAFDAGSETILACRIGPAECASTEFQVETPDKKGIATAKTPGTHGNNLSISVMSLPPDNFAEKLLLWTYEPSRTSIVGLDFMTGDEVAAFDVSGLFADVIDLKGTMVMGGSIPEEVPAFKDLWVLGRNAADDAYILHHYMSDGTTVDGFETIDLTAALDGEVPRALMFAGYNPYPPTPGYMLAVVTDTRIGMLDGTDPNPPAWLGENLFVDCDPSLTGLAVAGATFVPTDSGLSLVIIDGAGRNAHRLDGFGGVDLALTGTLGLAGLDGADEYLGAASMGFGGTPGAFSVAFLIGSEKRIVGFDPTLFDAASEVLPIDLVWVCDFLADDAKGFNTITLKPGDELELVVTVTVTDHNQDRPIPATYTDATEEEAFAKVTEESSLISMSLEDGSSILYPGELYLEDGDDGLNPTNADYLHALELSEEKTEASWIHCVGATTQALWTSILVHCDRMVEELRAERFAVLECPSFDSTAESGSVIYITGLQDYTDGIVDRMEVVADRNAVVFAGGAAFMDSDGSEYVASSVASACAGVMSSLEVHKSLINKQVPNVIRLVPEFSPGHIQQLIQARVNCVRLKPGRGYRIVHSLTAAPVGSDYSRVNDLRAVYYAGRQARLAAEPLAGEENDAEGLGLRRLESAMKRPLEVMLDHGQIDDFELKAVSSENDRLLGDVYVDMGIQPMRAMEMIYHKVFLK